jgi:hypothetical protein
MSIFAPAPPKVPAPAIEAFDMPTCSEGIIMGDLMGVDRIPGNIFWHGRSRVEKVEEEQEGGKGGGGSQDIVTGYKYYLSWAVGLVLGPVDELVTVWAGEDSLWAGRLTRPESGGVQSITLDGMGTCHIYFGTNDQPRNSVMDEDLTPAGNAPSRGLCYAFFDDCLLGSSNRVPRIDFVLRKSPEYAWSSKTNVGIYGYNPAHAIYHLIKEHTELPISFIDEDNFAEAADTLANEGRGIKVGMTLEQNGIDWIEAILTHIDATFFYADNSKFKLKLLRGTESTVGIPSFGEVDFTDEPRFDRDGYSESVNEVKVEFTEVTGEECPPAIDLSWDEDNSPETTTPSSSVEVYILGGLAPYLWSVTGGVGHSMSKSITYEQNNTLIAAADSCGPALVSCIDACGTEIIGEVRNTDGQWVEKGTPCGLPGQLTTVADWNINCFGSILMPLWPVNATIIVGAKKQYHYEVVAISSSVQCSGSSEDCNDCRDSSCGAGETLCLGYPEYWTLTKPPGTCGGVVTWQGIYYECGNPLTRSYAREACRDVGGPYGFLRVFHNDADPVLRYYEWECT